MKTNYTGIDYGLGQSNINHDTGIRHGVINQNEVLQAWCDDSEPFYIYACAACGLELSQNMEECDSCNHKIDEYEFDMIEPISFYYTQEGYQAEQTQDSPDIFVTMSPYFTYAQFCSPCAPGAVYLMNPVEPNDNNKGYCFGHNWFESGVAPYPVYSVETGEIVSS